jgi:ABC-type lipoprotein export system ATPase subunit
VATAYEELSDLFDEELKRSAFFVPVAFHVHSPGSFDWGRGPAADRAANDPTRLLRDDAGVTEFLDRLAKQFRIVCITDHLKSGFACALSEAAEKRDDITVFPGVEANVVGGGQLGSSRIHLLAIFPPGTKVAAIDRIYASHTDGPFPTEDERSGKEDFKLGTSLAEWAKLIRSQGGIFIAAHVDEYPRGLRSRFRVTREGSLGFERSASGSDAPLDAVQHVSAEYLGYIAELAPEAVEIMNPGDRQHYGSFTTQDGKTHRLPCVIRSDHHSFEEFERDELTTWVKVSRPEFKCVTDALDFFETRIRFRDDLPKTPSPRLVGVRLRSPTKTGLFEEAVIAFNPNLNCIIGPRGSGKSTVVEALRYIMGLNSSLDAIRAEQGIQLNYGEIAARIQDANLKDTIIEAIYEVEGATRYSLSATFDPLADAVPSVHTLDGHARPMTAAAIAAEFPVRLYSWSEIETLGRDITLQRGLLDRLVPGLLTAVERRQQIIASLVENRELVQGHTRRLDQLLQADRGLLGRYAQYKADFERVNTPEVAQLFADLDDARERLAALQETSDNLRRVRTALEEATTAEALNLQPLLDQRADAIKEWWDADVAPALDLTTVSDRVTEAVGAATAILDERIAVLQSLIVTQEQAVSATAGKLRVETQADPQEEVIRDQREERKVRFDSVTARRVEYQEAYEALREGLTKRDGLVVDLEAAQLDIAERRSGSRDELLEKLNVAKTGIDIGIDLRLGADRTAAVDYMGSGFLTRDSAGHFRDKKIAERCCAMANPTTTARALLAGDVTIFEADGVAFGAGQRLTRDEAKKLVDHFLPFSHNDDGDIDVVDQPKLLQILELQEKPVDDTMRILLGTKPVDQLSPGQRSSAMLPLVALSETAPLIIDQPEDNLDNRMIGQTLTKILADLKETRQIIVTTHNPNIVVGGDAEQVIVLEAAGLHEARVETTGSIDDPVIIENVVAIMEGGREAFRVRNRRYGIEP